ncbi:hypothetical protein L3Q82_005086 [Scortum barcoo]|uniref:Uncharacterized protein n=1 Tax=Scortum barcoo TaxID=214431 RepID=A0ACB8VDZ3_9TELE|nr:hypothetical protein L3Q82_005086 [Scortum barcoo]
MSTRQRKGLAAECQPNESQEGSAQPEVVSGQSPGQESVADISKLLQSLLQQQADRDARIEQERKRQDDRWRRIQHQFTLLQQQIQQESQGRQQLSDVSATVSASPREFTADSSQIPALQNQSQSLQVPVEVQQPNLRQSSWKGPKMQTYNEGEDIEHYLITFERIAHACQWSQDEWALHLVPLLTGKARSAYVAMDIIDTMDYAKVKRAVLENFEISAETYRVRFCSSALREEETPKELQVRLKDLYVKWLNPDSKTKEEIGDAIIMEQFLKVLNPELCTWIKERNPKTSKEAAEMAEAFLAARRSSNDRYQSKSHPLTPYKKSFDNNDNKARYTRQEVYPINQLIAEHSCQAKANEGLLAITRSKPKQEQATLVSWEELPFANEDTPMTEYCTQVQTDDSGVGLGAVLLQGEEGQQSPVQYISRKLFPREKKYSTIEKEALAIKWVELNMK